MSKAAIALKWLAGAFMGGAGAWSWLVWLAVGAGAMSGGVWWHGAQVEAVKTSAYAAGQENVRAERLAAENRTLVAQQERIATLITEAKEAQDAYETQGRELASLRGRLAAADRLRESERRRFADAVKSATADRLRDYAPACDANFERSRSHVERFGLEAIECSKAAHALKRANDALARPSAPTPPAPPSRP